MQFKRGSVIILSVASALFLVLFFGFKQKGPIKSTKEKTESKSPMEDMSFFDDFQSKAMASLSKDSATMVSDLSAKIKNSTTSSTEKIADAKSLSGLWYRRNEFYLAGHFAEEVAKLEKTAQAWHIAGSSYMQGLYGGHQADMKDKEHYAAGATRCFETAMKLEPANPEHEISLATVYTEVPPQDQPMKGILMLLDLNKKQPDNVTVLATLGRLAIKTGQYDKAIGRLEKARSLDEKNNDVKCLLSIAYKETGREKESAELAQYCK
jgi:tetratricopeptide (TPR) repeat protein